MAINILKSCKSVFVYVKNHSFPSHIRSSYPWRPPLAEILDPRLVVLSSLNVIHCSLSCLITSGVTNNWIVSFRPCWHMIMNDTLFTM